MNVMTDVYNGIHEHNRFTKERLYALYNLVKGVEIPVQYYRDYIFCFFHSTPPLQYIDIVLMDGKTKLCEDRIKLIEDNNEYNVRAMIARLRRIQWKYRTR